METYKNLSGRSGVKAYETTPEAIRVAFADHVYTYTYAQPGRQDVETMKALARAGRGLATYISQRVKDRYAAKD